jgi:hypothetical protein
MLCGAASVDIHKDDVSQFLNGSMAGDFQNEGHGHYKHLDATRQLQTKIDVKWRITGDEHLSVYMYAVQLPVKGAENRLRNAIRDHFRRRLLAKPDQGKVYDVTSDTVPPNHFLRMGAFTRFADWRFIHRARLGVVTLNGMRRFGTAEKRCRRCGHTKETLPHVLCHCRPHFAAITRRHNAILDRLVKAFKKPKTSTLRINQTVPGFTDPVRPDLVVVDDSLKTAMIVDVTIPFENRYSAFTIAREEKKRKYEGLADHLRHQGYEVYLDAFVVGALGGWDPENEPVMGKLKLGHNYCRLMRKLICTDVIRWSRDICVEHVTGVRQYEEDHASGTTTD